MAKCEIGDRSYYVGERFEPESNSCYDCLCTSDFNTNISYTENPNCAKINCGIELDLPQIRKGCVPVYFRTSNCCPIEFKCRKCYLLIFLY